MTTTNKAASPNTSASSAVPLPPIVHAIGKLIYLLALSIYKDLHDILITYYATINNNLTIHYVNNCTSITHTNTHKVDPLEARLQY